MNLRTRKRILETVFISFAAIFIVAIFIAYRSGAKDMAIVFGIGIVFLVLVAVKSRNRMPTTGDYKYFETYLSDNQYKTINSEDLEPVIPERSHYLSKRGTYSVIYSNPARKIRYIAALTPPDGRNTYSMLPEYTVFLVEADNRYCGHCLAFTRKSREHAAFSMIYGESYTVLDKHPTVQFYCEGNGLPDETMKAISCILERVNIQAISIECIDRWLLLAFPQIPTRDHISRIIDNLQTDI